MSADMLREAAEKIRTDCPIPESSRQYGFIDFPTGFAIQRAGVEHVAECSAAQTNGALLCDCEAIYPAWRRWRALLGAADWLEVTERDVGTSSLAHKAAEAFARAYLGRDS